MSRAILTLGEHTATHIDAAAHNRESNRLAVASSSLSGQLWTGHISVSAPLTLEQETLSELGIGFETPLPTGVTSLAWVRSANGLLLVAGGDDGFLHVIPLPTEQSAPQKGAKAKQSEPVRKTIVAHDDGVSCLHGHPTRGSVLVSGGADGGVRVWDFSGTSQLQKALNVHVGNVSQVQWHPSDANLFLSAGNDGFLKVSDLKKSGLVFAYDAGCPITCASWNPVDPTQIAIGLENGELRLVQTSGETSTTRSFIVHDFSVGCLAFSPDGSKIATGGDDFAVSITTPTEESIKKVQHHSDFVRSVLWVSSGSGFSLISGSWDHTLAVHSL